MRRTVVLLVAAVAAAAIVTWRVWPRDPGPVAPALSAADEHWVAHRLQGSVTLLPGGSRPDAHRLWSRYHHQRWGNPDGTSPRLVAISLAHVESELATGNYWIVYSDHVYMVPLGGPGHGGYGRAYQLVDPRDLRAASGISIS